MDPYVILFIDYIKDHSPLRIGEKTPLQKRNAFVLRIHPDASCLLNEIWVFLQL